MALTPLPPPAILKCGGHILLNAYMRAMLVNSTSTIDASPQHDDGARGDGTAAALCMTQARLTQWRSFYAGLIPDDQ